MIGNQLESEVERGQCFGIAANADFILVCTYEENGENPELIVYKRDNQIPRRSPSQF